jgi:DNA-binding Xre family transcriptional regulator
MVNVNKLKGKIVERGLSVTDLANMVGIDKATFYRKLAQNGETFSIREADLICKKLELNPQEATAIFFSDLVA